jgi:hypothetical protein
VALREMSRSTEVLVACRSVALEVLEACLHNDDPTKTFLAPEQKSSRLRMSCRDPYVCSHILNLWIPNAAMMVTLYFPESVRRCGWSDVTWAPPERLLTSIASA